MLPTHVTWGGSCRFRIQSRCLTFQQGQALIYGIFMLMIGLVALFFLFNTGQLTREKTKLVNTADAAAYSAGILHARTLNYMAYTNRAMIANTVAIAQLVSLASWVKYVNTLSTFGITSANPLKYPAFYASYMSSLYTGPYAQEMLIDSGSLEHLAQGSDQLIHSALMNAQFVAYNALIPARQKVMNEVAKANYHNDGTVEIDDIPLTGGQELQHFASRYEGNQRTRFADVAQAAANKDDFVKHRSWTMPSTPIGVCPSAALMGRMDWLSRRGGTNLIGFDEWKAMDTLSQWRWVPKSKSDALCRGLAETPNGWGAQTAADQNSLDTNLTHYDQSVVVNPGASGLAIATNSSDAWGYKGLPSFYDLSEDMLKQADPRLQFAIRVHRKISQTLTSEARSSIKSTARLNDYHATAAGGDELVAVSASEVFFERPPTAHDNSYGQDIGKPKEIGSLFNPYWQVHLIQSAEGVQKAQTMQGVTLP